MFLGIIATFLCFTLPIFQANKLGNYTFPHLNTSTNLEDEGKTAENPSNDILYLFKCPGSTNISQGGEIQNITELFRKYTFRDMVELEQQIESSLHLFARFTEKDPECEPKSIFTSVQPYSSIVNNVTSYIGHAILPHGWILKYYSENYWESIPPNKYCVSRLDEDDEFTIKYCHSDCSTQPCISKCCFANEVCDLGGTDEYCQCADSGSNKWTTTANQLSESNYSFVHHLFGNCSSGHFALHNNSVNLNAAFQNHFQILENGSVIFYRRSDGTWINLPEGRYCVDGAGQFNLDNMGTANFSGEIDDMVIYVCRNEEDLVPTEDNDQDEYISSKTFTILVPFATVFVILTIVVHILTWQEQNIHGYTFFFYLVTLLALYVFIVLGNVRAIIHPEFHPTCCAFIAGAIHFSYLSSACWVTCVSYDVWRTFKKMNNVTVRTKGKRRFITFCAFSIGYPLIQVCICVIIDLVYRDTPPNDTWFILPEYGGGRVCNMSNDGVTYYLYVPIAALLLCNMGFFVATIASMIHYKKSIREAFAEVSKTANPSKANQSFGIYARLFILMGIFWISQIISWFVFLNENNSSASLTWEAVFAITDALTILQAVAIFYIFVCKKSVFANLWILQPWLRPFLSLWIKYGCCQTPTDTRKIILMGRETLKYKKESVESNGSPPTDSNNAAIPQKVALEPINDKNPERQSSFTSDDTVVSEVEAEPITPTHGIVSVEQKGVKETTV